MTSKLGFGDSQESLKLLIWMRSSWEVTVSIRKVRSNAYCYLHIINRTDAEVETICKGSLDQSPHNYCCIAHRKQHSNCYSIIGRCFERAFSLALELDRVAVSFISDHEIYRRTLYSLVPAVRQQLRDAIQLEYDHIIRILARARFDTTMLRTQYEVAVSLTRLIAPIHWLPVELLESIFSLIPDEQNHKIDTLMHTCRRWKAVISSIWSPLKLGTWTPLDKVKAILDGENGLVSVTIDPSSDAMDRPIGSLETEQYAALMLVASTSTSRWRTLDILSLPDLRQDNAPFGDQSHTMRAVPMNHLRSLSVSIRHDSSRFLDLLLPSIGATTSVQLKDMHLRSVQVMLYLAQPHCAQVFNHLTSFRCFLPRTDAVVEVLPHFWHLEILEVSGLRFPTYSADIELPLTKTLRRMSLRMVPISWMNNRNFLRLEFCTIDSPLETESAPITNLPLCGELYFNGLRFDALTYFCVPPFCHLTLCSPQWNKSRGNDQLSHLWGASNGGALQPTSLHLHLTCSSEQLLQALCFMPQLKELVLKLDHPTALGDRFFKGFLRCTSQSTEPPQPCPLLEVLGLKYQRWFRQGEPNEMPALVTMALLDKRDRKIWVETGRGDQERIHINSSQISTSMLCSLGLLQLIDGVEPPSELVDDVIRALTILSPVNITFSHRKTMMHLSPSIYYCLFRRLRNFALHADVDQGEVFNVLAHFERLEGLYMATLSPSSSQPHLPFLRTLKRLQLGTTSLFWMEGCTFTKLEALEIQRITEEVHGQFQRVQMPMCKFASLPRSLSSASLNVFQMPQLHKLDLHGLDWSQESVYPAIQQFKLQTASFCFTNSLALQDILEVQPELEVLEIRESESADARIEMLPELLSILPEPYKMSSCDSLNHSGLSVGRPGEEMLLCPRLKELKLTLVEDQEWELVEELARVRREEHELQEQKRKELQGWQWRPEEREMQQKQKRRHANVGEMELLWGHKQVGVLEWVEKRILALELALALEQERRSMRGEYIRLCQKFMRYRMIKGYPLHRCQLAWGSHRTEILEHNGQY